MNKYLVSYFYKDNNGNATLGRATGELDECYVRDIKKLEKLIGNKCSYKSVICLNVVLIEKDNFIKCWLRMIRKKLRNKIIRQEIQNSLKKEFEIRR